MKVTIYNDAAFWLVITIAAIAAVTITVKNYTPPEPSPKVHHEISYELATAQATKFFNYLTPPGAAHSPVDCWVWDPSEETRECWSMIDTTLVVIECSEKWCHPKSCK